MKKMDSQLKQTLEEIGKQAFPDDQDAWAKLQQRMGREGTPNIMTNTKEQQRLKRLKLVFGLGSAVVIAAIILISLPGNQALAKTLRSLFLPDSSDSEMLTETASIHLIHTVEEGDTLSVIAQGYGVTEDEIIAANPGIDPNFLWVGQQLLIPAIENCSDTWETILYTVEEGDILFVIANRFGVTEEEIMAANPGFDPNLLVVGKQLVIPDVIQCASDEETMDIGEWVAETEFGNLRLSVKSSVPGRTRIARIIYDISDWTCGETTFDNYWIGVDANFYLDSENKLEAKTPSVYELVSMLLQGTYDPENKTFAGTWEAYIIGTTTTCSGEWEAIPENLSNRMPRGTWVAKTEFGEISFIVKSSNPGRTRFSQIQYAFTEQTCGFQGKGHIVDGSGWGLDPNNKLKVTTTLPKSFWTISLDGTYDPLTQTFTGIWEESFGEDHCSGDWEAFLQE